MNVDRGGTSISDALWSVASERLGLEVAERESESARHAALAAERLFLDAQARVRAAREAVENAETYLRSEALAAVSLLMTAERERRTLVP